MSKLGWIAGGWEANSFTRVPDGWLFSLPFVWSRRSYLVTDEQKALLSKPLRRTMWGTFIAVMILIFAVTFFGHGPNAVAYWAVLLGLSVTIMVLGWVYLTIAIGPLLAGLEPTQERITFGVRFRRQAANLPTPLIIIGGLFSLLLCVMAVAMGLTVKWDATAIFGAVFFGILTAYWLLVFAANRKIKRAPTMTLG